MQLLLLLFMLEASTAVIYLPAKIAEAAGPDGWFSVSVPTFFYGLIIAGVVLLLAGRFPSQVINEYLPEVLEVHKMRNILAKAPKSAQKILKAEITKVFIESDYKEALKLAHKLVERYRDQWPSAISCFEDDIESCLAHLKLPPAHHKATGTTNLIERLFEEGRRRTKVIGRFPNEGSCLRLFFATLMAASGSWRGVRMTPAILTEVREIKCRFYGTRATSGDIAAEQQQSRMAS